jgi:carbon-monoxide dehydrogenase large subunit
VFVLACTHIDRYFPDRAAGRRISRQAVDQAKDAAELLEIAHEPLPAVVRADAVKPGAPRLWDETPDNLCIVIEVGDEAATAEAFGRATHIVSLDTWVQRVTGVPMEPRRRRPKETACSTHRATDRCAS